MNMDKDEFAQKIVEHIDLEDVFSIAVQGILDSWERNPDNLLNDVTNEADTLTDDNLEDLGMGKCGECGDIYPIGKGENFVFDEETSKWLCVVKCGKEIIK